MPQNKKQRIITYFTETYQQRLLALYGSEKSHDQEPLVWALMQDMLQDLQLDFSPEQAFKQVLPAYLEIFKTHFQNHTLSEAHALIVKLGTVLQKDTPATKLLVDTVQVAFSQHQKKNHCHCHPNKTSETEAFQTFLRAPLPEPNILPPVLPTQSTQIDAAPKHHMTTQTDAPTETSIATQTAAKRTRGAATDPIALNDASTQMPAAITTASAMTDNDEPSEPSAPSTKRRRHTLWGAVTAAAGTIAATLFPARPGTPQTNETDSLASTVPTQNRTVQFASATASSLASAAIGEATRRLTRSAAASLAHL